ncbi:MAG: polymer-forming cytoskeletal protein [Blastocatellia bacterium]|nr:polymer-forming cytoskeletal protein [Blastocatellia bacterium]
MKFGSSSRSSFVAGSVETPTDLRSFLGEGTDINGEVKFTEVMRVDATISGTITSDTGSLLVMEKGRIKATIQSGSVEVSGIVEGTITAKTSVKIHATGRVYGDIFTPALIIEHGAVFDGKCHMLNGKDKAKPVTKPEKSEAKSISEPPNLKTADVV